MTYNICKSANIKGNYQDSRHDVNDFKTKIRVAIEFQVVLCDFKVSKRVDAIKVYPFRLLGIYLIDKPINSIILTLEKRRCENDKWMVTPPRTKKIIISINPLEC